MSWKAEKEKHSAIKTIGIVLSLMKDQNDGKGAIFWWNIVVLPKQRNMYIVSEQYQLIKIHV